MKASRLLRVGIIGTTVSAVCCFTPMLVILLGAIGWLDYVLLPSLAVFTAITIWALLQRRQRRRHG